MICEREKSDDDEDVISVEIHNDTSLLRAKYVVSDRDVVEAECVIRSQDRPAEIYSWSRGQTPSLSHLMHARVICAKAIEKT